MLADLKTMKMPKFTHTSCSLTQIRWNVEIFLKCFIKGVASKGSWRGHPCQDGMLELECVKVAHTWEEWERASCFYVEWPRIESEQGCSLLRWDKQPQSVGPKRIEVRNVKGKKKTEKWFHPGEISIGFVTKDNRWFLLVSRPLLET